MDTDKLEQSSPNTLGFADILAAIQDQLSDWSKWQRRLAKRDKPAPLRKLLSPNALFWGLPTQTVIHQSTTARLIGLRSSSKKSSDFDWHEAADHWLSQTQDTVTAPLAIESLAWAHALGPLVRRLTESEWHELAARLLDYCQPGTASVESGVVKFLLTCELPMTLAYALAELPICRQQLDPARSAFSESMDSMLDGQGTPHARLLPSIQLLLASCTRTLVLDALIKKGRISKAARLQYDWCARQTLRWTRPNGTTIFQHDSDSPYFDELMKHTLKLTKDDSDVAAFKVLRGKRKPNDDDTPSPTEHSEWSEAVSMRTTWQPNAARLAVTFPANSLNVELAVGRQNIVSGSCLPKILVDGRQLAIESEWEVVCWESDDDMDYIELECHLSNEWRLQRQFLLARQDLFALISDAVIGPETATIEYQHAMPLEEGVVLEQAEETTEATILGSKRLGTFIPLPLSEWKHANASGQLRTDPARLELTQRGRGIYAPLFVDLDPARRGKALTWRHLSVAQDLQLVARDVAVAFRVQIGKQQWVIYRSIQEVANRTFLGENLISEFFVARFGSDGETETIIDVT